MSFEALLFLLFILVVLTGFSIFSWFVFKTLLEHFREKALNRDLYVSLLTQLDQYRLQMDRDDFLEVMRAHLDIRDYEIRERLFEEMRSSVKDKLAANLARVYEQNKGEVMDAQSTVIAPFKNESVDIANNKKDTDKDPRTFEEKVEAVKKLQKIVKDLETKSRRLR